MKLKCNKCDKCDKKRRRKSEKKKERKKERDKEKATQKTEWLLVLFKSALQRFFERFFCFYWELLLTRLLNDMSDAFNQNIV